MKLVGLIIVLSINNIAFAEEFLSSDLKFHTQELLITSGDTARELYEALHVEEREADLVYGLWFKNDKYLFCWVEPTGDYFCSIYLDSSGKGKLSSFHSDPEYGKGDPVDFIVNKPVTGEGQLYTMKWGIDILVEGELATFLRKKLYRAPYDSKSKLIKGDQVACSQHQCLVRVHFSKVDSSDGAIKLD